VQRRLLDKLVCPDCQGRFTLDEPVSGDLDEIESATLVCTADHAFPVVAGIPRLLTAGSGADLDRVRESFSREWAHHELGDRTWYVDLETRVRTTFVEALGIPPSELAAMTVLDAGCGNGSQSVAFTEFADEVIAVDLSTGLELGYEFRNQWPRGRRDAVHFMQADVTRPPLPPRSIDVLYSFGVLHHTPDTRASFEALVKLLRPGGTGYVWVYRYEPFWTPLIASLRAAATRVPVGLFDQLTRVLAWPFVGFTKALDALGVRAYPRISRDEAALALLDIFAAPYAHYHSPDEVRGWFAAAGFVDVRECTPARRGFGMVGRLSP